MASDIRNFLYRDPQYYEIVLPDPDESTPKMCVRMFSRFMGACPSSILDVGCGTGRDLDALSRTCPDCWGVDRIPEMIAFAESPRPHLNLQVGNMRSVRLGRTFDVVMCMGSSFMYALTNDDVERTLKTFAAHSHAGTLLILDLLNASSFLGGGNFKERMETKADSPEFSATAVATHAFDRRRQLMTRRRVWDIPGEAPVEDFCEYRLFFPAELDRLLADKGFKVAGMFDEKELKESDLSGSRLYVAAIMGG